MSAITIPTDQARRVKLRPRFRAYFSVEQTHLGETVWLRLETAWVADATAVSVTLTCDREAGPETLETFDGETENGVWEKDWEVTLPDPLLDELPFPATLRFEATLDGHADPVQSTELVVRRARFSS